MFAVRGALIGITGTGSVMERTFNI